MDQSISDPWGVALMLSRAWRPERERERDCEISPCGMTNMANAHDRLHTWIHTQNNNLQACTELYISVHAFMCTIIHVCLALKCFGLFATDSLHTHTYIHLCMHIRCEEFIDILIIRIWNFINHLSPVFRRHFSWTFKLPGIGHLFQWSGHLDIKWAKCVSFTCFDAEDVRSG